MFGLYCHLFNMGMLVFYNIMVYVFDMRDKPLREKFEWVLILGILYPAYYEIT